MNRAEGLPELANAAAGGVHEDPLAVQVSRHLDVTQNVRSPAVRHPQYGFTTIA
jgi:hypothetical protein